jgi:cysteinyl-tRNA synthetase
MLRHADQILDVIEFPSALDDAEITRLIEERRAARAAGNFARSDEIRELLRQRGIQLDDTKEGSRWKRIS